MLPGNPLIHQPVLSAEDAQWCRSQREQSDQAGVPIPEADPYPKVSPCNFCWGRFHSDSLTLVKQDVLPSLHPAPSIVLLIYVGG
jgi:hypothetical protein